MSKVKFLILVLPFFIMNVLSSQKIITGLEANKLIPGSKLIRYTSRSKFPNHVMFSNYKTDRALELNSILKLPKDYTFQFSKQDADHIGFIHQEYKQLYKNIPVEYGVCKAHIKNNYLESISGDIYEVDPINIDPVVSSSAAILKAKQFMHADKYKWEEGKHHSLEYYPTCELMILVYEQKTYLTYKVDVYSIEPLARKFIYIDAATGSVIHTADRIHHVDVPATCTTAYSGVRPITVDFNGVDYTTSETGRGLETINYATGLPYNNSTTTWSFLALDQYAMDAHWGTEMTYDYFFTTYGRDGLDNAHYFLTSYVNEGPGFGNAYWDGSTVHYGDGDGSTFTSPLTNIGIVGHEMTHGLTQFSAGLVYAGESGAMNESFSDIFGLCVDKYARNINLSLPASWLVGAECTGGTGIRNMANPNAFGMADTYGGSFWNAGDIVHFDSGVQNFWFYLLTMGGTGTNDNSDVYNVNGLGIADAGAIAYRNLAFYLTPGSGFDDSRYYSLIAAQDLFGACSPQVESVANAWYAVGVGLPYQNVTISSFTNGNSVSCEEPISVNFTNLSFNASSYLWDFGDGDTSSQENPIHLYSAAGTYNVELIATGCGANVADTFITSITISTGSSVLNIDPAEINNVNCCSGDLFDSGGPAGDYQDAEVSIATIQVPAGNVVNIDFSAFDLEDSFDYLSIHDGPDGSYPLIGSYTGNTLPNGGLPITSTSNIVYVEFTSDGFVIAPGFELNWYCTPLPPVSGFSNSSNIVCIGSTIEYYNNSTYYDSISWNFQGGSPLLSNADTVLVTYNSLGTYTTTLTASNIIGTNSSTSSITVVPLPSPSISLVGNLVSITPAFLTYEWYLDGSIISGASSQDYTILQGGSYYCVVTDNNGCSNSSSAVTSTLSINNDNGSGIMIYPNPATTNIFIKNELFISEGYKVTVMNVLGDVIFSSNYSSSIINIDLTAIKAGTYFIKIGETGKEITKKIVVVK